MEFLLPIIIMLVVGGRIFAKMKASEEKENKEQAARQAYQNAVRSSSYAQTSRANAPSSRSYSPTSGQRVVRNGSAAVGQRDGRVYATIDFDNTHYHAEGFDFDCCISFKGLPAGTDELAVLIASNNRHERELAKLLQTRD